MTVLREAAALIGAGGATGQPRAYVMSLAARTADLLVTGARSGARVPARA